jgi:UDP-GlcNAc:undecaprenyl-phosphate GlcNAc-1-phosphate transferase
MFEYSFIIFLILLNIIFLIKFEYISQFVGLFDHPDFKRKIHNKKISCLGGVLIFLNITILLIFNFFSNEVLVSKNYFEVKLLSFIFFYVSLFSIFLMGLYDDKYGLKPNIKILILFSIVLILLFVDKNLSISYLRFSFNQEIYDVTNFSIFFTTLCILVFINAFNMYDGSNLQVSPISIVIFSYLLILQNYKDFFLITLIISLITFSFLNFKNKLFLGDNGSLILSFVICYVIIKPYNKEIVFYADQVCLFLLLPVIDLLRLFIMRVFNGKNPFKPDKNHLHHILIKKFDIYTTKFLLFGIYSIPVIFGLVTEKYLLFIILQILIYLLVYFNLRKKKDYAQ